jgi:hypothetical protein
MKYYLSLLFFILSISLFSQTKVGGYVYDEDGYTVPYASVYFKNSTVGVVADDNGKFYLEAPDTYKTLVVSFVGFKTKDISLTSATTLNMKVVLEADNLLQEVKVYVGKTSKKDNPALDILRKIWERRKKNGLYMFSQYKYDKYEKIEFDLNSIDSAFMQKKVFKGMEFVFDRMDTSSVTGKTFLPIFINESLSEVYGDNNLNKKKEIIRGNKNSGLGDGGDMVNGFLKDLYAEYNIYNNYLKFFDKDFVSPLSRTGINVYNYVLADTAYIDNKLCYNIVFYPRRKGELTFKGDFWVNDTTFAIKKINLQANKSANINWVKDIYIEQEFDVLNDSVFLLKRDYMMTDFSISKKEESKGLYGKRSTLYKNYVFDQKKAPSFYKYEVNEMDMAIYNRSDEFWEANRFEKLNKNEKDIYTLLDTLSTVPKFKMYMDVATVLASGYYELPKYKLDFGPVFSAIGYNDIEGLRLRAGGRTYFGPNDKWRLQGYLAYGFKDDKFKYGVSGKLLIEPKNRVIIHAGNRRDVEQMGASLTATQDVLGRSLASSTLFSSGINDNLTNINLTTVGIEAELVKNLTFKLNLTYRMQKSAFPSRFSLAYYDEEGTVRNSVKEYETQYMVDYTPKRRMVNHGVERIEVDTNYPRVLLSLTQGIKGVFDSDFNYDKLQFYYKQPILIGGFGRFTSTIEAGKFFGTVPLALIGVIPGNQSWFAMENAFQNMKYYEFVADEYVSAHLEHNFGGRLFSRVPWLRDFNLREIVMLRGVYGDVSEKNKSINASNIIYRAPQDVYWEYGVAVGNIFKCFRLDFSWRGAYKDLPDANKFAIKGSFGFYF